MFLFTETKTADAVAIITAIIASAAAATLPLLVPLLYEAKLSMIRYSSYEGHPKSPQLLIWLFTSVT